MNVLMVNKFLYPKGGCESYVLRLGNILKDRGHNVEYFGLDDERNTVSNSVGAYAPNIDFQKGVVKNLTAPFRIIYSARARKEIRKVLDDFSPDIVHLNNIQFHLTPSIIIEIEKYRRQTDRDVKIIYTAHDYQLVCPSHGLFDSSLNVCEKCLCGRYRYCVQNKCVKGSRAKSLIAAVDGFFWKKSRAYSYIDRIICCSEFLKTKLDSSERLKTKTVAVHNFVDIAAKTEVHNDNYVLQFGHLSEDKGTLTLLEVAKRMPNVKFVFAGYGAAVWQIEQIKNAEFVGFKKGEELRQLIMRASVSVCPSEMYENCPFSVIESQLYLTPVVGARIGGIPELIDEGRTGELFEPKNVDELESKLRKLLFTKGLLKQYSENCKNLSFETADSYYEKLMRIYGE